MVETQRIIEYVVVAMLFSFLYLRSDDSGTAANQVSCY
jgi:hypothetical protein